MHLNETIDFNHVTAPAAAITDDINIDDTNIDALLADIKEIDDTPTFGSDSESLKRQAEYLRLELQEKYANGSVDDCVRIKAQLEMLPIQIRKAQIAEAKSEIERANAEIADTQTLIDDARGLRTEREQIFAEKMRAAEDAGTAVGKVNFLLWRLDLEMQNHRGAIRHHKAILQELIEPIAEK